MLNKSHTLILMNDAQKIIRHDTIISFRETVCEWFNNGIFGEGCEEMYKAKLASQVAFKSNISIIEINEIVVSFLFNKGFSNEFINAQLSELSKVFSQSLYTLTKFKMGEVLYTYENNTKVVVLDILPLKPKQFPVYSVKDQITGFEYLITEINLFKSNEIFDGAKFRVHEIVYPFFNKKNERHKRLQIVDITKEEAILDGYLYQCIDKKGTVYFLNQSNISLYSHEFVTRNANMVINK